MSKTILVPTDFSENANNAIKYAITFAERNKNKLLFFHVSSMPNIHPEASLSSYKAIIQAEEKKHLEKLEKLISKNYASSSVNADVEGFECFVKTGFVVDEIIDIIKEKDVEMIIMGTQGASGIKEFFLGSHTASVIEKVVCPVFAIPEKATFREIKKIVFATDYYDSDFMAIRQLVKIASAFNAEIVIIHISDGEYTKSREEELLSWYKEMVNEKVKYKKISYQLFANNNIYEGLYSFLENFGADVISMSTQRRNFLEKLFGSSLTKKMAYHTRVPLLAFHASEPSKKSDYEIHESKKTVHTLI